MVVESNEFMVFKERFTREYIDPYINRLLGVRTMVKEATTPEDLKEILDKETAFLNSEFGVVAKKLTRKKKVAKDGEV